MRISHLAEGRAWQPLAVWLCPVASAGGPAEPGAVDPRDQRCTERRLTRANRVS